MERDNESEHNDFRIFPLRAGRSTFFACQCEWVAERVIEPVLSPLLVITFSER